MNNEIRLYEFHGDVQPKPEHYVSVADYANLFDRYATLQAKVREYFFLAELCQAQMDVGEYRMSDIAASRVFDLKQELRTLCGEFRPRGEK